MVPLQSMSHTLEATAKVSGGDALLEKRCFLHFEAWGKCLCLDDCLKTSRVDANHPPERFSIQCSFSDSWGGNNTLFVEGTNTKESTTTMNESIRRAGISMA